MSNPSDEEIKQVFGEFDADNSGHIDASEIRKVCEKLGVEVSQSDIDDLIKSADDNGDGKISYDEFKKAVTGG